MGKKKGGQKTEAKQEEQIAMFPGGPTVASLHESDILASLSAFARAFNTDRETLRRCLLEHEIEPAGERAGHKLYALRHVYHAWAEETEETDPDKLTPFKRRAWYQGEREKVTLQELRGELVPALEMERHLGQVLQLLVRGLETAPDVVERECGLSPKQAASFERHIDKVREDLYQAVLESGAESDEPPQVEPQAKNDLPVPVTSAQKRKPKRKAARPAAAGTSSAVEDGVTFLQKALARGPRPSSELIAEGKKSGLSEATLRRAKASMGEAIEARRQGRGWAWQLASK